MKIKSFFSFAILAILLFTHCTLRAQWVRVDCPVNPLSLTAKNGYLFAGSDGGVARSSDNGVHWVFVNYGLSGDIDPVTVHSLFSIGKYLLAGAENMDGLYLSTNNGNSWIRPPNHGVEEITSFVPHDSFIFVASSNTVISRSSDSGNSWKVLDSGLTLHPFGYVTTTITSNSDFVFCGNDAGQIYRSTNGDRWSLVFQDPLYKNVYTLGAIGPVIFAQFQDSILRSLDNGDHWQIIKRGGFAANSFFSYNNIIFAGGYYGIIYSSNNGDIWKNASEGLPDSVVIDAFTIKDGYLYTGAYFTASFSTGGLWRRPLSDFAINSVKNPTQPDLNISLSPNPTTGILSIGNAPENLTGISILNVLGEKVMEITAPHSAEFTIDIAKLPAGIYFVRFVIEGEVITRKIIRE